MSKMIFCFVALYLYGNFDEPCAMLTVSTPKGFTHFVISNELMQLILVENVFLLTLV